MLDTTVSDAKCLVCGKRMPLSDVQKHYAQAHPDVKDRIAYQRNDQGYIHEFRIEMDGLLKRLERIRKPGHPAARNLSLAITYLEDARMRLGMALGDLGEVLPAGYPHDRAEE